MLTVEHTDDPAEIVIHVNMLKEGWDVTNLYTIVPLRAANARTLIEQSIGRGLRLPYGKRTGVTAVDRLNIVAHDRFQEIIDEANKPDSPIRLKAVVLRGQWTRKTTTVVASPTILSKPACDRPRRRRPWPSPAGQPPAFTDPEEQKVARTCLRPHAFRGWRARRAPSVSFLSQPGVQALCSRGAEPSPTAAVGAGGARQARPSAAVIAATAKLMAERTIDIPRIIGMPQGRGSKRAFVPFTLNLHRDALSCAERGAMGRAPADRPDRT